MGNWLLSTVIPFSFAFSRLAWSKLHPSANMIHAASVRDATARVFTLAITVTHAAPCGIFDMAILSKSQQYGLVTSLSNSTPSLISWNSLNVLMKLI